MSTAHQVSVPSARQRGSRNLVSALALAAAGAILPDAANAGTANFATTNIQYLYGTSYELGDETRSIVTLEHANAWKYGDNFFFVDITNPDRDGKATKTGHYVEISPRLSFGKMTGRDLSAGIFKDVLLAGTVEIPDSPAARKYLYGLGVDLNLPGFRFFQVNTYIRNSSEGGVDTGQQVTLAWNRPFSIGSVHFSFEGFFDYAWGEDPLEDNIITAPRLLVDVGALFGAKPGQLQAGIEYQIWRNKFGIDGIDEDVAQTMIKWIW